MVYKLSISVSIFLAIQSWICEITTWIQSHAKWLIIWEDKCLPKRIQYDTKMSTRGRNISRCMVIILLKISNEDYSIMNYKLLLKDVNNWNLTLKINVYNMNIIFNQTFLITNIFTHMTSIDRKFILGFNHHLVKINTIFGKKISVLHWEKGQCRAKNSAFSRTLNRITYMINWFCNEIIIEIEKFVIETHGILVPNSLFSLNRSHS